MALMAFGLFEMPIEISFCLAYACGTISAAILVPGWLALNDKGYGKNKGIPSTMIASGTFENVVCIICFGICKAIGLSKAEEEVTGETKSIAWPIGLLFVQIVTGIGIGALYGLTSWFFKFIMWDKVIYIKCAYCVLSAILAVVIGELSTFTDAVFIGCIAFGYVCFRFWGEKKPSKELGTVWFFI